MKKVEIKTECKKLLADVFTPVSIYLRLRDRFRDTILLESTDSHSAENSYSFICINAIGGIEISNQSEIEFKLPCRSPEKSAIKNRSAIPDILQEFMQKFAIQKGDKNEAGFAQGLFGYITYDAIQFFESLTLKPSPKERDFTNIPLVRYRLYQYVIVINHFKDELFICENIIAGLESELQLVESLIRSKDVPVYPFKAKGKEISNTSDEDYIAMVKKGIQNCHRGDVFQIVLSRRFEQQLPAMNSMCTDR